MSGKTFTVISVYKSWVYDDIIASSESEALSKAHDVTHTDEQIMESLEFQDHIIGEE